MDSATSIAEPELLTVKAAADIIAVSRSKAYELIGRGDIPTIRVGSSIRVPRRRLLEWIDANTHGGSR